MPVLGAIAQRDAPGIEWIQLVALELGSVIRRQRAELDHLHRPTSRRPAEPLTPLDSVCKVVHWVANTMVA
jgi:hypothetical protein